MPYSAVDTASEFGRLIGPLRRAVLRTRLAEDLPDLPEAQIELLRALEIVGTATPSELAAQLRVAPSTISNLVRTMTAAGLVRRTPSTTDLRTVQLGLSPKSRDMLAPLRPHQHRRTAARDRQTHHERARGARTGHAGASGIAHCPGRRIRNAARRPPTADPNNRVVTAKPPLLLLHGVTMSAAAWADVVPLLIDHYDVIAPTAAGHHGGPPLTGKANIGAFTDQIEGVLDTRGLDRVHIAGNSLGGWIAIELARRNRALSVCAFSPAGFWTSGRSDETRATRRIRRMAGVARITRPVAPAALRAGFVRRLAMRDIAEHGERLTAAQAVTAARDTVNCSAASDLLGTSERVEPLDPVPVPDHSGVVGKRPNLSACDQRRDRTGQVAAGRHTCCYPMSATSR